MNSYNFLLSLSHVDEELVQETLDCFYTNKPGCHVRRISRSFKTALIAAILTCLFAGLCTAAYALNLFGLRDIILGGRDDSLYVSVQGLQSSNEFLAYQEFLDFYEDYTANNYYGDPVPQPHDEWMASHERIYFGYTQTLKNKILELCDKYSLKTRDGVFERTVCENSDFELLYSGCGVSNFILDSCIQSPAFLLWDDGSFRCQNLWISPKTPDIYSCEIWRSMKGYFGQGCLSFESGDRLKEYNYTTKFGTNVTIVMDIYTCAVLYDGADAFVTATLDRSDSETEFTPQLAETLADAIDFEALGVKSPVHLPTADEVPTPEYDSVETHTELTEELAACIHGQNEWLSVPHHDENLEFKVNSISLSTNIYDEGWTLDQFDDGYGLKVSDFADVESGELCAGFTIVTVEMSVHNTAEEDLLVNQTPSNEGRLNNFSNAILFLQRGSFARNEFSVNYIPPIAWSGENPVPGQYAYVHIAPGETVTYKLGYIMDEEFSAADDVFLSTIVSSSISPEDVYIPVTLAE